MPASFVSNAINEVARFLANGLAAARLGRRSSSRVAVALQAAGVAGACGDEHRRVLPDERAASVAAPIGPALARRMRTGRLPLPRRVADMSPADEPALAAVNAFADRLAELPLLAWLTAGRKLIDDPSAYAMRETSYAILEATINAQGLAVAAWHVRDAIETSAYYASRSMLRWTSKERRAFAAAHAAAEDAALAILAQPHLAAEDVAALCAPFSAWVSDATSMRTVE